MHAIEHTFTTWDGLEFFYRAWIPAQGSDKALLLFHRGHEHSGRWQGTVDSLGLDDVTVFAWDARGHGRSPGERGSANNLADVVKDVHAFARHISQQHGIALENTHRSRDSPQQTEDVLDQRRLTRAVGADESENCSARHRKAHVVECHLGAKAARYILDLDHGRG